MLYTLVRRETGDTHVARRALWILSLLPGRLRPGHGLRRVGPAGAWPSGASWPCGPPPGERAARPHFALAGRARLRGGPDPAHRGAAGPGGRGRAGALVAPARPRRAGGGPRRAVAALRRRCSAFLAWSKHAVGDWWAPLRVQLQSSHHGGLSDPFATLYHDATGVVHHHVGTALHVPVGAARPGAARRLLAAAPGPLHPLRGRVLAVAAGRGQPRFVRALRPQRLPAVDRRRRCVLTETQLERAVAGAAGRPGSPATPCSPSSTSRCPDAPRSASQRPPLTRAPPPRTRPRGPLTCLARGRHPMKHPSSSPARGPVA